MSRGELVLKKPLDTYPEAWGGRVMRWCWVYFQCRGLLLIWIIVGQWPTALKVGAGWVLSTVLQSSAIKERPREMKIRLQ